MSRTPPCSQAHAPDDASIADLLGCRSNGEDDHEAAGGCQWIQLMAEAGYVLLYTWNLPAAADAFEGVMALAPQSVCGMMGLSETRLRQGRTREAEVLARRAASMSAAGRPEVSYCHRLAALALRARHRAADAITELRTAAALDPEGPNGRAAHMLIERWTTADGRVIASVHREPGQPHTTRPH